MRYLAALVASLLLVRCAVTPAPPLPPPDGPGDCTTACANIAALGGCGLDMDRCEQDCRDAEHAEADIGIRFPVGCLTASRSCAQARSCE